MGKDRLCPCRKRMKLFEDFRKSNRGASLVLVSAFSIIIVGIAITLTVISSMLLAKANAVRKQGQAYELATSLAARIEEMVLNGVTVEGGTPRKSQIDLDSFFADSVPAAQKGIIIDVPKSEGFQGIPDSSVKAVITQVKNDTGIIEYYTVTVTAEAAGETYVKTMEFTGNASMGYERR